MSPDSPDRTKPSMPDIGNEDRWTSILRGHWQQVRPEELSWQPIQQHEANAAESDTKEIGAPKVELSRRQELERRLKENPTDLKAFMELSQIYRAENRPQDARRILEQATQIFPDDMAVRWEYEEAILARSLQQLRQVADVANQLKTIESQRELKRAQDDWARRRIEVCRARLNRDPSLAHLRIILAEGMHDAGMHEQAIEELEPLLTNDELSPTAYLIQSRCQLALGKDLEGMSSLRAAAMRRSVVAPVRLRIAALRLLCETAERIGVTLTLQQYRQHLQLAEAELKQKASVTV